MTNEISQTKTGLHYRSSTSNNLLHNVNGNSDKCGDGIMSKGNNIQSHKANEKRFAESMTRNAADYKDALLIIDEKNEKIKELLTQNDILEAEKADIVKAYNDLHSACHHSAGEFKEMKGLITLLEDMIEPLNQQIKWLEEDKIKYEKLCKKYMLIGKIMCGIVFTVVGLFLTGVIVIGGN